MSASNATKKKPAAKRGRPLKGNETPVVRRDARKCEHCKSVERFRVVRSPVISGIIKTEWLRCMDCNKITRFRVNVSQ